MTSRRSFLGALGALLAMPVVGQITPAVPKTGRGMTASIFHVDEAAFFPTPITGKSGQVLVSMGAGKDPEWRDPTESWIKSDKFVVIDANGAVLRDATADYVISPGFNRIELP